jgi:hypothetical protein
MLTGTLCAAHDSVWKLETVVDPSSYQNVSTLSQASQQSISDEYGVKEVQPRLEFRCIPGSEETIAMRIDWQRFISSFNTEVTFVADDSQPLTLKLGVDRSNKITLARDAADVTTLIAALKEHQSLRVNVTPYSEAPVDVSYEIGDLAQALARLEASCAP